MAFDLTAKPDGSYPSADEYDVQSGMGRRI